MAGVMPTQIAQVNDFTAKASEDYIRALQNARGSSPIDALSTMLNMATKASESQKLTDAVDAYNRAMEGGKTASEALQGLDPRITGSKAFKDEADKIRNSILAQAENNRAEALFANQMQRQGLQDQAMLLGSDFQNFMQSTGPDAAPIWLEKHKNELSVNPFLAEKIAGLSKPYNTTPYGQDSQALPEGIGFKVNPLNVEQSANDARNLLTKLSLDGALDEEDLTDALYLKNFDAFVDKFAKDYGYEGEDRRDFRDNMADAYATLSAVAKAEGGSNESVLSAMRRYLTPSGWSYVPFAGRFAQDIVDTDKAKDWLVSHGSTYDSNKRKALTAKRTLDILDTAVKDNTANNVLRSFQTQMSNYKKNYEEGKMTKREYDQANNRAYIRFQTMLSNIGDAMVSNQFNK